MRLWRSERLSRSNGHGAWRRNYDRRASKWHFFEGIDDSGCVMIPTTLLVQINGIIGVLQSNIMLTMRGDASLGQIHGSYPISVSFPAHE